ncbi:UTP--glucose-1-phosphate uridylyltransferase [Candidatus Poriferisodalis sp.]|uniref:UTP--glucose-1-phosphate uridylyltransferase n=1 Tax=Candidatus Poriferisodalis sp. TaxID=3101277 RepID=UPI003B02A098
MGRACDLAERYGIDEASAGTLAAFGFDGSVFDRLRQRLAETQRPSGVSRTGADADAVAGDAAATNGTAANWLSGGIEPPRPDDLVRLPLAGSREREQLAHLGREAIAGGQVGVLLLAGGMATRFGGGVKALAEVLPGLTFVDAKLAGLQCLANELECQLRLWLMTSFRSDGGLREWAAAVPADEHVKVGFVPQGVSMRLTPSGELFRDRTGNVSLYAPGHGDAPWAMQRSGELSRFADDGGRCLFVTNVDNAAATLDPAVIGAHLAAKQPLTCEVVKGAAAGGSPWRVDGRLQIVESFRLPPGADPLAPGTVNTNSLVADVEVFSAGWPLTWFEVRKQVDGLAVVQFERLIGELSAFVDTTMLLVERDGSDGRFQPVKDPAELEVRRPEIARILSARIASVRTLCAGGTASGA